MVLLVTLAYLLGVLAIGLGLTVSVPAALTLVAVAVCFSVFAWTTK